jgi:hypothetical protein
MFAVLHFWHIRSVIATRIGERSAYMVGTGEIKYPGWTKSSTAARQFDIELSRARGRKLLPAIQVQILIWIGDSGSNPERAHRDKFFVYQRPNLATQQEV